MSSELPCPNCGAPIAVPIEARRVCPHCKAELEQSTPHKLGLARPISTYLGLADSPERVPAAPVSLSARRQRVAAQRARERFAEQRRAGVQVLSAGTLLLIFGAGFVIASALRLALAANDWIGIAGIALGIALMPLGGWMIVWSLKAMRAWREEEAQAAEDAPHAGAHLT